MNHMNQSIVPAIIPATWGPRGRGAEISYTIVDSPFGRMLVAVTARGICALSVHQSDEWQESELRRDFREAKIIARRRRGAPGRRGRAALPARRDGAMRSAAGCQRHAVSTQRMARAVRDSRRLHAQLRRDRGAHRTAVGGARRRPCQRLESGVDSDPVPSRDRRERQTDGLSMGPGDQKKAARFRTGARRPHVTPSVNSRNRAG